MVDLVYPSPIDWYYDKDDDCYDIELEEELYNMYWENLDLSELYDTYLENLDLTGVGECDNIFSDCNKILKVDTSTFRLNGANKCGVKNVSIPEHTKILGQNSRENTILPPTSNIGLDPDVDNGFSNDIDKHTVKEVSTITSAELYEVHNIDQEVITRFDETGGVVDKVVPNGTLPNIKEYARIAFGDDVDQQKAFTQLVAAFVVKLHKKVSFNKTFDKKRYTNGKLRYDFNKPVEAWIRSGTVDCLATIVDTNVLSKLKNVQEQNNGIDLTHLKYLDFVTDYKV